MSKSLVTSFIWHFIEKETFSNTDKTKNHLKFYGKNDSPRFHIFFFQMKFLFSFGKLRIYFLFQFFFVSASKLQDHCNNFLILSLHCLFLRDCFWIEPSMIHIKISLNALNETGSLWNWTTHERFGSHKIHQNLKIKTF